MKRQHLFEFEDQAWLPGTLRDLQTDFLRYLVIRLHIFEPAVPLIEAALQRFRSRQMVDLCSGAAGPWEQLLENGWDVTVTLTDRYPNQAAFAFAKRRCPGRLDYCAEPVDARDVPGHLAGMRILFNSFHHFRPVDARAILQDAMVRRTPIGIFEIAELTPRKLLAVLFGVPLLCLAVTPFVRPLSLSRLIWTYGVPLVPACLLWDGLVSLLRAYTPADLAALAAVVGGEDYQWKTGRVIPPAPGVSFIYLLGCPRTPRA